MALIKKEEIAAQEKELNDLNSDLAQLNKDLDDSSKRLEAENAKLKQEEENLIEIVTDKARNEQSLRLNEKTRALLNDEIASLEKLNKDLEDQIAVAKEAGDTALVEKLRSQQDNNKDKIAESKEKVENLEVEATALKDKITENETEEADRKASIDSRKADIASITAEIEEFSGEIKNASARIEELEKGELLNRYNLELEIRQSHARDSVRNKERIKPMLFNSNTEIAEKKKEMEDDSGIFIADIKAELEFTPAAEEIVKAVTSELNEEGVILKAVEAFKLSRKSIFDVSEIMDRIELACSHGQTSVTVDMDDVSGTKLIILNDAGYKISHIDTNGDDKKILIDWGFAEEVE